MDNFVYFWIPSFLEFNCNLKSQTKEENISDDVEGKQNILKLEFLENYDIKLKYDKKEYNLKYINHKYNGIFIYKFNDIDKELLKVQVYHLFKEICHIHNSHNEEEDSLLSAYISSNDGDIDNAIKFYCKIYLNKFKEYKNIISEFIEFDVNDFKIDEIKNQKELLLKAKEEMLYAFFLSKNTQMYDTFISLEKQFDILLEKLSLKETEKLFKTNNIINKWQFILAGLGVVLGMYFGITGANNYLQQLEIKKIENILTNEKQLKKEIEKNNNNINEKINNLQLSILQNKNALINIEKE